MSASEKIAWLRALLAGWGFLLFCVLLFVPLGVEGKEKDIALLFVWLSGGFTVAYPLILSWRAAYLSGRGRR